LIANWHKTSSEMHVIFLQQLDRNHDVINVVKNKCMLIRVPVLLLDEGNWVLSPMSAGIEVVGGMVSIIVTKAITLYQTLLAKSLVSSVMCCHLLQHQLK
jgi:hypothetical protein